MTSPDQPTPGETPAIDVSAALARLIGDRALFARVLRRFRADYRDAPAAIGAAIAAADAALAVRLTHTLKGAAGMIEARSLHRCALELEQSLRAGREDSAKLLGAMVKEMERAVREIDRLLADGSQEAAPPRSSSEGTATVRRLRALLDAGDGAASDVVRSERAALSAALGATRFAELAAAVDSFNFPRAARLLDAAAAGG